MMTRSDALSLTVAILLVLLVGLAPLVLQIAAAHAAEPSEESPIMLARAICPSGPP